MADPEKPLLIKRYASRRLYNTETSDYVTLDDIAGFIRGGRDVQIIDLKSGENLTRQYLLQIIAEHESKGESVLPVNVLTDLVRSYTSGVNSMVPQFLAQAFDMLRDQQSKMVENLTTFPSPMVGVPAFEAMKRQQDMFLKTMMSGWAAAAPSAMAAAARAGANAPDAATPPQGAEGESAADLDQIKAELAVLQAKLSKL